MNKAPLISVVMPVYNGEATVLASITSILAQTYKNLELIVVDDQSTDGTLRLINSVRDPRVRVISHPKRNGVGAIRRFGTGHARGEYVAVLDSDDIAFPERLEAQLDYMRRNSLKLCGTWAYLVGPDGQRREFRHPVKPEDIRKNIICTNCFVHSTVMFTKEAYDLVGGYNPSPALSYVEDYDLWLRMVARYPAGNLPRILAEYSAPKDNLRYLWREQTRTAYVRLRAILRYGYPLRSLFFVFTPLFLAFIPKKVKLLARKFLFKGSF
ncbi:MAG: hypothetical protein A2X31_07535 [Elusimicrobia bacterium GWB2_63_22]|nr:MAG: hypothetical protein A2X31_07535 [Elusimicrobia bacterium GWB2_63_22]